MKRSYLVLTFVFVIVIVFTYVYIDNMCKGTELISFQSGKYSLKKTNNNYSLFCDDTEILRNVTNYSIETDGSFYMVSLEGCAFVRTDEMCMVYFKNGNGKINKNYIVEEDFDGFTENEQKIFKKLSNKPQSD